MADAMLMYGVTAGIFAFLVAVVFGARECASAGADKIAGQNRTLLLPTARVTRES
jgi:hypothetical protein